VHCIVDLAAYLRRSADGDVTDDLSGVAKGAHIFYAAGAYVA
jgi:hypothetical protein